MRRKYFDSLCDVYAKGGYWGFILGITASGAAYNWNGNRVTWIASVIIVLAIYLYHMYRIHKYEFNKVA